jgi:hypothetical protein
MEFLAALVAAAERPHLEALPVERELQAKAFQVVTATYNEALAAVALVLLV